MSDDICPRCRRPWNWPNDNCADHQLWKRAPIMNGTAYIDDEADDYGVLIAIRNWLVILACIVAALWLWSAIT